MQRILDIIISATSLLLLLPLLVVVISILWFTGEKEVFYRQMRVGRSGNIFPLLKFATMLKDSPKIGSGELTLLDDPRVLPFGRVLRKSKINELPQLVNVLLGQMSIVGPRPMVPNTFTQYPANAQEKIVSVRPGLTGIGSIIFRDEEKFLARKEDPAYFYRNSIIPYKSKLELWFVNNNRIGTYLKIIFVTAIVIIKPNFNGTKAIFSNLPGSPDELMENLG